MFYYITSKIILSCEKNKKDIKLPKILDCHLFKKNVAVLLALSPSLLVTLSLEILDNFMSIILNKTIHVTLSVLHACY